MDYYAPYPSHVVDEGHGSESTSGAIDIWLQPPQTHTDANLVQDPDLQFALPEPSEDQVVQLDVPTQSHVWLQGLPAQEDASLAHLSSAFTLLAPYQDQLAPPQPPSLSPPETNLVQADASPVHVPTPAVTPAPSQHPVDSPTGPPWECPIGGRIFKRRQERNRHLRAFLPHPLHCPFPYCPWRGNRYNNLKSHWVKKHPNCKVPHKKRCQIYDPDPLVEQIVGRQLSIEVAAERALSTVQSRVQELNKANVWEDGWGHKQQKSHGPVCSTH